MREMCCPAPKPMFSTLVTLWPKHQLTKNKKILAWPIMIYDVYFLKITRYIPIYVLFFGNNFVDVIDMKQGIDIRKEFISQTAKKK